MILLITLIVVVLFAVALSPFIKKHAALFYLLAVLCDAVYLAARFGLDYIPQLFAVLQVMQKGLIAFVFFVVVMYIGALRESSWLHRRLAPIRAELSLLGCLFALGHATGYLTSYLATFLLGTGIIPAQALFSMLISLTSLVLMLILGATTLSFVRVRMDPGAWKKLQRLAYIFFGLVYIHLMIMLVPALRGNTVDVVVSVVLYTIIVVGYACARIIRAREQKILALQHT